MGKYVKEIRQINKQELNNYINSGKWKCILKRKLQSNSVPVTYIKTHTSNRDLEGLQGDQGPSLLESWDFKSKTFMKVGFPPPKLQWLHAFQEDCFLAAERYIETR